MTAPLATAPGATDASVGAPTLTQPVVRKVVGRRVDALTRALPNTTLATRCCASLYAGNMHQRLRARFVHDLVADIDLLSGAAFETFGYTIVETLRPSDSWVHPGTNLSGAPVKGTVDSIAEGGRVIAQYTSEASFFAAGMAKAAGDVAQARKNHPNVKELWLLSSRRAGPGARKNAAKLEGNEGKQGLDLHVVDSRMIAKLIAEHLDDDRLTVSIRDALGSLRRIEDEHTFSHAIPVDPQYVPRGDEMKLASTLQASTILELTGMSGVGKSALARDIAARVQSSFELVVWVDAGQISSIDLRDIEVRRRGLSANLLGLLKRRKSLVVLDDLRQALPLKDLMAGAHPGSRLIVTSQYTSAGGIRLGTLEQPHARMLLDSRATRSCPDDIFEVVWHSVGGHAGALTLLGGLAHEDSRGWAAVRNACDDPGGLEDEKYQRLADRILAQHRTRLTKEIALLAAAGSSRVDAELWKSVCGPHSVRGLERRGMLAASTDAVVHVHDLVFASARSLAGGDSHEPWLVAAIAKCVEDIDDDEGVRLDRLARTHQDMLKQLAESAHAPAAIRYAFALTRPLGADHIFARAVADGRALAAQEFDRSTTMKVRAALEALEALYGSRKRDAAERSRGATTGSSEARAQLEADLPAYDDIADIRHLPEALSREIEHHHAKMLNWLGRKAEARDAFTRIVASEPQHAAARLQLARIHADAGDSASARTQIDAILSMPGLNLRKALGAFGVLAHSAMRDVLVTVVLQYESRFLDCFDRSLAHGDDQAIGVVSSLGTHLWYDAQPILVKVASLLRNTPFVPSKSALFSWAQCLKHCAKAVTQSEATLARGLLARARDGYARTNAKSAFECTQQAECLVLLGDGNAAADVLDTVPDAARNTHWHHRRAQAYRLCRDWAHARLAIDLALTKSEPRYQTALLHERYLIRCAAQDVSAIEDLDAAIASCTHPRYKTTLEEERGRATTS